MTSDVAAALNQGCLLADGAMATQLQRSGLPVSTPAAAWSLTHPEAVLRVHRAYVDAGCDIVLTNTLQAHSTAGGAGDLDSLNRVAVALARQSGARWVAGSMGPGADDAQARALADAGVDLFWLETQLDLGQSLASVAACGRAAPALPIVVTFSFHRPEPVSRAGDTADEIARAFAASGILALGANCGEGFAHIDKVFVAFSAHSNLPLVMKPNAGVPRLAGALPAFPLTPTAWAATVDRLRTSRVRIVGGCCGTTPAHIRKLLRLMVA